MIRVTQMNVSTEWLLFTLTTIIYVTTFFILQMVADKFRDYILCHDTLIVSGVNTFARDDTEKTFTYEPVNEHDSIKLPVIQNLHGQVGSGVYRELHEALDVSVFR